VTVLAVQILQAQAKGLINVTTLAKSCDEYSFPFYLACVILDKETDGRNIYGHDVGGIFTYPDGRNVEVTEANYAEFLRRLAAGETSNGVGCFQLTFRGYHIGSQSLTALGYKAWIPADNIRYAIGRILAPSLKSGLDRGLTLEQAFWQTAKSYNGNASYADDAIVKARTWAATVGTSDMEVGGLEINSKMHSNARHVIEEVLDHFPAIKVIWTYATFPDHSNCRCCDYMVTSLGLTRDEEVKLGDAIAAYLIKNADRIGLNWLIWNRRIYRHQNTDKGHGWADYTGPKPHTDHVHMEVDDRTSEEYMPTANEIAKATVAEQIRRGPELGKAIAKGFLSVDDVIPAGADETNAANKFQVPATFIKGDHDLLLDIREALEKLATKPTA
jgi:hypothetical protein